MADRNRSDKMYSVPSTPQERPDRAQRQAGEISDQELKQMLNINRLEPGEPNATPTFVGETKGVNRLAEKISTALQRNHSQTSARLDEDRSSDGATDLKGNGYKVFLPYKRTWQRDFRHPEASDGQCKLQLSGDGFSDDETGTDFTFFSTGRHKRRCTKTAPELEVLQLDLTSENESMRRTPIRPRIQQLKQHQQELRRTPVREFWPTLADFTDASAVHGRPASQNPVSDTTFQRKDEGSLLSSNDNPGEAHSKIVILPRNSLSYVPHSAALDIVDFANFRRIHKSENEGLFQLNQVRVWRVDSDVESEAESNMYEEVEYESESESVSSSFGSNVDHFDHARVDDSNSSDRELSNEILTHEVNLQNLENCAEMDSTGSDSSKQKDDGAPVKSLCTALWDDQPTESQSYSKMVRARRAISREWPTDSRHKRQLSDLSPVERELKHVPRADYPKLSRQLTA